MFVFRNEVSEPKVWVRFAQFGLEGRGQGGSGGAQLPGGAINNLTPNLITLNPIQHAPLHAVLQKHS